jgi:hypothetical protein
MRLRPALSDVRVMSTHIFGLTVAMLADASLAARTVDHAVTLVDDAARVIVVVDLGPGHDATGGELRLT